MKYIKGQSPVSEAIESVGIIVTTLHDLISETLRKAPEDIRVKATGTLESAKELIKNQPKLLILRKRMLTRILTV